METEHASKMHRSFAVVI